MSKVYGGSASERSILQDSKWEEFYEEFAKKCVREGGTTFRPDVMADKGTRIRDMVEALGAKYFTPSMLTNGYMTYQDAMRSEYIAKARGHVEKAIGKMKTFDILKTGVHGGLVYMIDGIVYFIDFVTHFFPHTLHSTQPKYRYHTNKTHISTRIS